MPALKVLCPDKRATDVAAVLASYGEFERHVGLKRDGKNVTVFWRRHVRLSRCAGIVSAFRGQADVTVVVGNGLPPNVTRATSKEPDPEPAPPTETEV